MSRTHVLAAMPGPSLLRRSPSPSTRRAAGALAASLGLACMTCGNDSRSESGQPASILSRAEGEVFAFDDVPAIDGGARLSFSEMRFEAIGATRAALRFRTDRPTSCEAEYGPTTELGQTADDPAMEEGTLALDHRVVFEDLTGATSYFVRARATDAEQRTYVTGLFSMQTAADGDVVTAENVALASAGTRVVSVSSNFGGGAIDGTWGANHAIDGSMRTEWSTDGDGDDAWLELDLGASRNLELFGYRSRDMQDGTAITTSVRLIVDDVVYGPFDTPDPAVRYLFELTPPPTAQLVRFEVVDSTGGNTGARQIELYGQ